MDARYTDMSDYKKVQVQPYIFRNILLKRMEDQNYKIEKHKYKNLKNSY